MIILYVEDHEAFVSAVKRQFLSAHTVSVARSISDARSLWSSDQFDAVLVDFDLPDGKGDEFVREIRADNPNLLIVAVSSHAHGNAALIKAGASIVCGKLGMTKLPGILEGAKVAVAT